MPRRTVIPFSDYQRIFGVIHSVLEAEGAKTAHACIFWPLAGALILSEKYGLAARPVAGAAAFVLDSRSDPPHAAFFGRFENSMLISAQDAFRCWVEADGIAIDFMAPLFGESIATAGSPLKVPRNMFQKPLAEMANSFEAMKENGDFIFQPDPALHRELFSKYMERPGHVDLLQICTSWFRRPPKTMLPMGMASNSGAVMRLQLKAPPISGIW